MSTEISLKSTSALVLASKKDLERIIVQIAAVLPPKLSEDMPFKAWVKLMSETVGDHPVEVLNEARSVMLSACGFAPTPKEFVDAVLSAYAKLRLPLSDDAKRHLGYRKKVSSRYVMGEDGKQRYLEDAKLTTMCFVSVAGVHANMVLDKIPEATVSDVERALLEVSEIYSKKDKATINDIVRNLEHYTACEYYYRTYGKPEDLCGGIPAEVRTRFGVVKSHCFRISQDFLQTLCIDCPDVSLETIGDAYFSVAYGGSSFFPEGYGTTFQAQTEARLRDIVQSEQRKYNTRNARWSLRSVEDEK